jgi:hypothetical protein
VNPTHKLLATFITAIAALTTTGSAADPHSKKIKQPPPLPPGLEWADTNHDGKLSNDEFKHASQILSARIQKVKSKAAAHG